MADLPKYDQWMKDTYSLTSPRSDRLKKLDEAIKAKDFAAAEKAFGEWCFDQRRQAKNWRNSVRNKKGAMTALSKLFKSGLDKRLLSAEELDALMYIANRQAMALQKQFEGAQVQFKASTIVGMARGAGGRWQHFKNARNAAIAVKGAVQAGMDVGHAASKGASASGSIIQEKIIEMCRSLCPGLDPNQVFASLKLPGVQEFANELAPFLGAFSSGGKAIAGWIKVISAEFTAMKIADSRYAFAPGDPEAALNAIIVLLDREIKSEIARASVHTGAFAGKLAGAFADGGTLSGPIIGVIEILADIFQTIIEYVRDYKECELAKQMIFVGALNLDLFSACPLLGAYFLAVQDHSTIINFAVGDYGKKDWMLDVESLRKKIGPALDRAGQYIRASRLEIVGMTNAKGAVQANWSKRDGLSQVLTAPEALADAMEARIDAWFENPEKPPKVDKSRIYGMGNDSWNYS